MPQAGAEALPALAGVTALGVAGARGHQTVARGRIDPPGGEPVGSEGMRVVGAARYAIVPGAPTVQAAHESARFDGHEEPALHMRVESDSAHMACVRSRRE